MVEFRGSSQQAAEIIHQAVWDVVNRPSNPDIEPIYRRAADALLLKVKEEYDLKSRGGTDAAGIKWKLTKRFLETHSPMLFRTGDLFKSLEAESVNGVITVRAVVDYAAFVLKSRPAWPEDGELPDEWWEVLAKEFREGVKELIEKRLAQ